MQKPTNKQHPYLFWTLPKDEEKVSTTWLSWYLRSSSSSRWQWQFPRAETPPSPSCCASTTPADTIIHTCAYYCDESSLMMAGKIMMIFGCRTFDSQWWKLPAKMPLSKSITPWHQSEQIHNTWDCKFNLKPERFTTWLANKSDWIVVSGQWGSLRFRSSPFLEPQSLYLPFCPHGDSHFLTVEFF